MNILLEKFKNKDVIELSNALVDACSCGDIEIVKHLLTYDGYNLITHNTSLLNKAYGLDKAAVHGHLNIVEYLLINSNLKNDSDLPEYLNSAFQYACMHGHLSIVDFLLTSEELKIKPDIHSNEDDALFYACSYGHLDIVKYLLESPKIKEHSSILSRFLPIAAIGGHLNIIQYLLTNPNSNIKEKVYPTINEAFFDACAGGQLDTVEYLLKSDDLKTKADLHYNKDSTFDIALRNHRINILEYFILNLNIEKSVDINNCLKQASSNPSASLVNKLFEFRDLKKEIINDMNVSENNKRVKI
jgi:ankyrin repeat protein